MTEPELRAQIGRSREDGFRALFQHYKGYVYTIVWDILRGAGTAEDIEECVSDVFAAVFLHFDAVREGTLDGYVAAAARNTAVSTLRRLKGGVQTAPLEEEALAVLPDAANVQEDAERSALRQQLLDAVTALGEPDASILMQRFYYERSYAQIARTLKMRPGTVRMRAARALKRLRDYLTAHGISPD